MPLQSEFVTTTSYYSADEYVRSWNTDHNAFHENNIWNQNRTSKRHKLIAKASKNKRFRTTFTTNQIEKLQEEFLKSEYLCKIDRIKLAKTLNLNERQILIWFQNRRMKKKRECINNISSNFNKEEYSTVTESTFSDEHNIAPLDCYNGQEHCNYYQENYINQDCQNQYYNYYNKYQLPATELEYSLYYQTFEHPSPESYCT